MNGEVYLWPSAAEKKLRTAYQTELPAYLYGVTGVGKTSLIEHFLDKKPYQYFSALNTIPEKSVRRPWYWMTSTPSRISG